MKYFGTNLTEAGHYTWDLDGDYMSKIGLLPKNTPFNPEELTNGLSKCETIYYQGGGYTVLGISGSCIDSRLGTKSIFWVYDNLSKEEMVQRIKANKLAVEIIKKMPFQLQDKLF